MRKQIRQIGAAIALLAALCPGALAQSSSPNQHKTGHALTGEVKEIDHAAGKITVKTADGVEETFKYTERTVVRGLKEGGKATVSAIKEGSHIVVHYVGEGAEKTAVGIKHIGKDAPKFVEGTISGVDKGARSVVVKTKAGAEETLRLTERAVVDTGKGVVKGTEYIAKEGERVTVHYTEAGGQKVVHLLKRIM